MTHETSFTTLSDHDLIVEARRLSADERTATATLIACLAELDARRLHLGMGYSSLHDYCAKALHLTDYAGYARIEAARVARRFPLVLELLRDGSINLTTISLLGRHLTVENHDRVLRAAFTRASARSRRRWRPCGRALTFGQSSASFRRRSPMSDLPLLHRRLRSHSRRCSQRKRLPRQWCPLFRRRNRPALSRRRQLPAGRHS